MAENSDKRWQPPAASQAPADPGQLGNELPDEVARCWGRAWPGLPWAFSKHLAARDETATWVPSMDVYETDGELVVKVELPGVKQDAIAIELGDGGLVIHGERKPEREVQDRRYYRLERHYGAFQRHLPLPFAVMSDQIAVRCSDGVLEIRLPKPTGERSKPQPVTIA